MDSIGNDVVALGLIHKERTCQHRFYKQILNPAEEALYSALIPPLPFEHFVWLLWSVKESAYKYLKRLNHQLIFSPSQILVNQLNIVTLIDNCCPQENKFAGTVSFKDNSLCFYTVVNQEYIHTVITHPSKVNLVEHKVQRIDQSDYEAQSAAVRTLVLDDIALWLPGIQLQVVKHTAGYPLIQSGGYALPVLLSFAHHGHFVAYAFDRSFISAV